MEEKSMAEKKIVLVDSDILIKTFRENKTIKNQLDVLKGQIAISVVTAYELLEGANSKKKMYELLKQFRAYQLMQLNESISLKALTLFKTYKPLNSLFVADALIAATALV
ncbi:MAG: PIN domain-containing protein [Bacteroidia bacterium]